MENQNNQNMPKPPSFKKWQPEVKGLEDKPSAFRNFNKIKEEKEAVDACKKSGFWNELVACYKNSYKNIVAENDDPNRLE